MGPWPPAVNHSPNRKKQARLVSHPTKTRVSPVVQRVLNQATAHDEKKKGRDASDAQVSRRRGSVCPASSQSSAQHMEVQLMLADGNSEKDDCVEDAIEISDFSVNREVDQPPARAVDGNERTSLPATGTRKRVFRSTTPKESGMCALSTCGVF